MKLIRLAAILAASLCAFAVEAQTLTFTAETVTGSGSVEPKLTWSTTPAATSCTASGDEAWTGAKEAQGTATLPAITTSRTYNLTCTWPAGTTAKLSWEPPTQNTDGSAFTDPGGYTIHYGTNAEALVQSINIANPSTTAYTVTELGAGAWYFCVRALNQRGGQSECSDIASKTLEPGSANRTVGITVNPVPLKPTNLIVE